MKSKKALMGLGALLILIFHFYIPFMGISLEQSFYKAAYLGVDLFFLVSACSLGKQERICLRTFLPNRLRAVWLPFAAMAVLAAIVRKWKLTRLLSVLCGLELVRRGGGSFLWFAPAILIVYLLTPALLALRQRLQRWFLPVTLLAWAVLAVVLQYVFGYTTLFILLNRLPIFLLGLCWAQAWPKLRKKALPLALAGLILGALLILAFGGTRRLNKPISELYYLVVIPFTVSLAAAFELLYERHSPRLRVLEAIGGVSFEVYGFQMIFGYALETRLLSLIDAKLVVFLLTAIALILLALATGFLRKTIKNQIKTRRTNT